jgi:uncharacterized MAPEG superfamily protein
MHFATWMVLIAALLPYATVGGAKSTPDYDNAAPRRFLDRLEGWRERANAAHHNHFEAFPAFAAGVILAEMAHAPQTMVNVLAAVFVFLRFAYTGAYLAGKATLRSAIWFAGAFCVIALFVIAA